MLNPGETPYDRPDIVNRVYEQKRNELLRDLTKGHVFGDCDAHVAVIEFQKRGAPHCHILIWIKDFEATPKNIDDVICAEILPPTDPLHETVVKTMIYGPCGPQYNIELGCCKNEECSKGSQSFSTRVLLSATGVFLTIEGEVRKKEVKCAKSCAYFEQQGHS